MAFQTVGFIQKTPELHLLRVLPVFLVTICGLLVVASMGGISKQRHILEDVVTAAGDIC